MDQVVHWGETVRESVQLVSRLQLNVPAAAQLSFGHSTCEAKTRAASSAAASLVGHNLGHIVRQKKVAGEACRQHAADLDNALFPLCNRFKRERIPHNYLCECGNVLVARAAIGVYDADVLHHSIKVNDTVRGAIKGSRDSVVEGTLIHGFVLQTLPAAAVQDVDIGQTKA